MVRAQHRLVREVFGIDQLLARAGLSMGGMQTLQWAVAFPEDSEGTSADYYAGASHAVGERLLARDAQAYSQEHHG